MLKTKKKSKVVKIDAVQYRAMRQVLSITQWSAETGHELSPTAIITMCKNALKTRVIK